MAYHVINNGHSFVAKLLFSTTFIVVVCRSSQYNSPTERFCMSVFVCLSASICPISQIFDAYGIWPWLGSPLAVRYAGLLPVLWMTSLPIIGQAKATQRTLQYRCETWHDDALVLFSAVNTQDRRRAYRYIVTLHYNNSTGTNDITVQSTKRPFTSP